MLYSTVPRSSACPSIVTANCGFPLSAWASSSSDAFASFVRPYWSNSKLMSLSADRSDGGSAADGMAATPVPGPPAPPAPGAPAPPAPGAPAPPAPGAPAPAPGAPAPPAPGAPAPPAPGAPAPAPGAPAPPA